MAIDNGNNQNHNDNWVPKEVWQQLTPAQRKAIKSIQGTPRTQANLTQTPPNNDDQDNQNNDDQDSNPPRNGSSVRIAATPDSGTLQPQRLDLGILVKLKLTILIRRILLIVLL